MNLKKTNAKVRITYSQMLEINKAKLNLMIIVFRK